MPIKLTQQWSYRLKSVAANELADLGIKVGTESIPINATEMTVAFNEVYPSPNYTVLCNINNSTDNPSSMYAYSVKSKTVGGFTIEFSGQIDSPNYVLEWATFGPGTIK